MKMETQVTEISFGRDGVFDHNERVGMIKEMLHEHICEVTFTKVNGEVRTMPCTLKTGIVPVFERKEGSEPKKQNPDTMSVFCTDKNEWRSFRVANVTHLKVIE